MTQLVEGSEGLKTCVYAGQRRFCSLNQIPTLGGVEAAAARVNDWPLRDC